MLCGDGGGKNATCQGDSGGPILIKGSNDASDVQVGVSCYDRTLSLFRYAWVYHRNLCLL